uniref:Uncharacterized protein n=1 Tax=Anguilla anguilla TaxID=7936 RepID=A0A0E9XE48_ANGAN
MSTSIRNSFTLSGLVNTEHMRQNQKYKYIKKNYSKHKVHHLHSQRTSSPVHSNHLAPPALKSATHPKDIYGAAR